VCQQRNALPRSAPPDGVARVCVDKVFRVIVLLCACEDFLNRRGAARVSLRRRTRQQALCCLPPRTRPACR